MSNISFELTLPFVHSLMSSVYSGSPQSASGYMKKVHVEKRGDALGFASANTVGLLSGKIIGLSQCFAISFTTCVSKDPGNREK